MATKREFYTTNQVAQTLGISPFTIRRYIHLRKLKAVKLEGSYRVRRADLERFLKAREIETEDELNALEALEDQQAPAPLSTKRPPKPAPAPEEDEEPTEPASPKKRPAQTAKKTPRASKSNSSNQEAASEARPAAKKPTPPKNTGPTTGTKDRTRKTQRHTP